MQKLKLLAHLDSPTAATGFGTVSKNILRSLYMTGKYDITIAAINHPPADFDRIKTPYDIFPNFLDAPLDQVYSRPSYAHLFKKYRLDMNYINERAYRDLYNFQIFAQLLCNHEWDIVLTVNDIWINHMAFQVIDELNPAIHANYKAWVGYFPVDGGPLQPEWAATADRFEFPVTYTEYARKEFGATARYPRAKVLEQRMGVIPHGVDTSVFKHLPQKPSKKQMFGVDEDTLVVTNVSRFQIRKDILSTLQVFKRFNQAYPKSILYLNMATHDQGGRLDRRIQNLGLEGKVFFPGNFGPQHGIPIEELNKVYNVTDIFLNTALGEGWGLPITEAMACRAPVVAPDNTAMGEILAEGRGFLARSGTQDAEWEILPDGNEIVRAKVNTDSMVDHMVSIADQITGKKDRAELDAVLDKAYKWVTTDLTWANICKTQWLPIFEEAAKKPTVLGAVI